MTFPQYIPIVLAVYCGLRRSEALGLSWSNIDFENNKIFIGQKVLEVVREGKMVQVISDEMKTESSRRSFKMISEVKEIPVGIFNAKPTKQTVVINNNRPMDTMDIGECFVTISDECRGAFRAHVERQLRYFPDVLTADKAAEIIGYAPHTVLSYIRQKRIFAVQISGKYILPKSALVEFIISDAAFEIVHKSTWHMNTILVFIEKNNPS